MHHDGPALALAAQQILKREGGGGVSRDHEARLPRTGHQLRRGGGSFVCAHVQTEIVVKPAALEVSRALVLAPLHARPVPGVAIPVTGVPDVEVLGLSRSHYFPAAFA